MLWRHGERWPACLLLGYGAMRRRYGVVGTFEQDGVKNRRWPEWSSSAGNQGQITVGGAKCSNFFFLFLFSLASADRQSKAIAFLQSRSTMFQPGLGAFAKCSDKNNVFSSVCGISKTQIRNEKKRKKTPPNCAFVSTH